MSRPGSGGFLTPNLTIHRDPIPLPPTPACPLPERHPRHPWVHRVKALALPVAGGPCGVGESSPPASSAAHVHRLWGHWQHQSQLGPHEKPLGAQAPGEADDQVSVLGPLRQAFPAEGWPVPPGARAGAAGQLRGFTLDGRVFLSEAVTYRESVALVAGSRIVLRSSARGSPSALSLLDPGKAATICHKNLRK